MNCEHHRRHNSVDLPLPAFAVYVTAKGFRGALRLGKRAVGALARGRSVPVGQSVDHKSQLIASLLFDFASEFRLAHGLAALRHDDCLTAAAYGHAVRMAETGEFAHTLSDGVDVGARIEMAGLRYSAVRENIAYWREAVSPQRIASRIHVGWVKSPGHRENLLADDVTRLGVAVFPWSGGYYAVQDFATPVGEKAGTAPSPRTVLLANPFGGAP
jgi:uncharacterized protein YkwD